MPPIFSEYKKLIDTFLLQFLDSKKEELALVNSFGANLCDRIGKMSVSGKSIRGSLALLAYCFTNAKPSENAIKIAAALELLQTALVTHDDIMDRDAVRRGIPSFYVQYKSDGMAMCVGDLLFFLAMELLGSIKTDEVTLGRIVRFTGREYGLVCLAQMGDVAHTAKSKDEIVSLYTYKTARYTFAVPLMLGAILTGTTKNMLKYLESYGVAAGVLFQIRDDTLDHEESLGADIVHAYQTAGIESVGRLPISESNKQILRDLLHFVVTREK